MPKQQPQPTADEQNAVTTSLRPSGSSDEPRPVDLRETPEQYEISKIARAQLELLRTLAKIAVEKLHSKDGPGTKSVNLAR